MAIGSESTRGRASIVPNKNQEPSRERLARHCRNRPPQQQPGQADPSQQPMPSLPQLPNQAPFQPLARGHNAQIRILRMEKQKAALTQDLTQAKTTLDLAAQLVQDNAIPQKLRDEFTQTRLRFEAAAQGTQIGGFASANARLIEHKRAAVNLINGRKGAELKEAKLADQASLFDDVSQSLQSVKNSSFPVGQAAYIAGLPDLAREAGRGKAVTLEPLFKAYLTKLAELEARKAETPKAGAKASHSAQLQAKCGELLAAADDYLEHYNSDLTAAQQQESVRLSEKRYCEEGELSARQYLLALEFDAVPDPKQSLQGWTEEQQIRAASVRAKVLYHEAYQQAATLGDGGDTAGASESRWLQGADWQGVQAAPSGSLRASASTGDAGLNMPAQKRTAIFKAGMGEKAPDGMSDKKGAGAIKEALACANAKLFAQQTGIDLGVPETNLVAVPRYALKGGGPEDVDRGNRLKVKADDLVVGSAQQNAGASKELADLTLTERAAIDVKDVHRVALIDLMSLNCDRHAGNLMIKPGDRGQPSLVPIDHGGSLPSRADFGKAKSRIAGVGADGSIVNTLLTMPAAYEPFDPATLAQLGLLDPQAIEDGMKRQRQAMDAVHPGLDAKGKLPDTSLHLAKRSMMFTKRAAKVMSPAEIQIVLGQRGEELFDVDDDDDDVAFNNLADQLIRDFVPLKEAYKEVLTGSADFRAELIQWLTDNGWVQFDPSNKWQPSGAIFLMKNPELALTLFRSGTSNQDPPPQPVLHDETVPKPDAKKPAAVTDELKERYLVAFPISSGDTSEQRWIERAHYLDLFLKAGGPERYKDVLEQTGAETDSSPASHVEALQLWKDLRANTALLRALKPNGAGVAASVFLTDYLTAGLNAGPFDAVMAAARQSVATVVVTPDQVLTSDLVRVRSVADDAYAGAQSQTLRSQADAIEARVLQGALTADAAHEEALALEARARRIVLEAIVSAGHAAATDAKQQMLDASRQTEVDTLVKDIDGACLVMQSINAAHRAMDEFDSRKAELLVREQKEKAERALLPAFDWDADAASTVKKTAIRLGFIRDKDTGMSAALKSVSAAQKELVAVLGDLGRGMKSEKKRQLGDNAIAAHRKFIAFIEGTLRSLAAADPPHRAWTAYCDGAVKATNEKIALNSSYISNWG